MGDSQKLAKWNVATALLNKGSLYIHLDPRCVDVVVPHFLQHTPQLVLQVGWDMPIPIPDLRVDADGICGTLSFSRTPFHCNLPWQAVFALVGDEGQGSVWENSMPPEIAAEIERETQKIVHNPVLSLKSVKPVYSTTTSKTRVKKKKKLPPYLRVVK